MAPNISLLDMLPVKRLHRICFFFLLVTWMAICISNIYTRLDNVNTSLNIVTESLIPIKEALCIKYTNNTLYSTNGKLIIGCYNATMAGVSGIVKLLGLPR